MFQAISGIFPLVPLVFLPKISCGLGPVRLDFSAMPFLSLASKKASRSMPQSQKVRGVIVEIQSILRMDDILMILCFRVSAHFLELQCFKAPSESLQKVLVVSCALKSLKLGRAFAQVGW